MNDITVLHILERNGFKTQDAETFINEIKPKEVDFATKKDISDLQKQMAEFKVEVISRLEAQTWKIEAQTWKFLGGLSVIAVVLKLCDYLSK